MVDEWTWSAAEALANGGVTLIFNALQPYSLPSGRAWYCCARGEPAAEIERIVGGGDRVTGRCFRAGGKRCGDSRADRHRRRREGIYCGRGHRGIGRTIAARNA